MTIPRNGHSGKYILAVFVGVIFRMKLYARKNHMLSSTDFAQFSSFFVDSRKILFHIIDMDSVFWFYIIGNFFPMI